MTSSSASDQLDLEKAQHAITTHADGNAEKCLGGPDKDKECEGWAAGQDALAPACSRVSSRAAVRAEDQGRDGSSEDPDEEDEEEEDSDHDSAAASGVVGRVLSRITSKSSVDPGPPPDGGWVAWSQCLIAHLVIFTTW
ncbi:hypothetical protein NLG97_g9990 [Lecanicillium saksenae]|uniref:Uncharacterized protein n=1 Tax=Lecanicillium saksenae TaxID=468837 RepID=A0ACC1QFR8_9HYPO|nr:hypothetical protein NLG97_g9990 [Lecanicillium saksenae]